MDSSVLFWLMMLALSVSFCACIYCCMESCTPGGGRRRRALLAARSQQQQPAPAIFVIGATVAQPHAGGGRPALNWTVVPMTTAHSAEPPSYSEALAAAQLHKPPDYSELQAERQQAATGGRRATATANAQPCGRDAL